MSTMTSIGIEFIHRQDFLRLNIFSINFYKLEICLSLLKISERRQTIVCCVQLQYFVILMTKNT